MLAVLGLLVQEQYHFPWYPNDMQLVGETHAWGVAKGPLIQLLLWISGLEIIVGLPALVQMMHGSPRQPGEFGFGTS